MAKAVEAPGKPETKADAAPTKAKRADRKTREMAQLLRNIGAKYVDAAVALSKGDQTELDSALGLIATYQDLFNQLSRKASDAITAQGLANVSES